MTHLPPIVSFQAMAIFGDDILWNGTVIHHATTLDIVLDHIFVVLSLVLLILSSVCNPIVFWFHRRMKQNTPAILFQILTANDFLTCILVVPVLIYYLIAGVSFQFCLELNVTNSGNILQNVYKLKEFPRPAFQRN